MDNAKTKNKDVAKEYDQPEPSTSGLNTGVRGTDGPSDMEISNFIHKVKRNKGITVKEQTKIDDLVRKTFSVSSATKEQVDAEADVDLMKQLENSVAAIIFVAKESTDLSNFCKWALKVAATSIIEAGTALISRTLTEEAAVEAEVTQLQNDTIKLSKSLHQSATVIGSQTGVEHKPVLRPKEENTPQEPQIPENAVANPETPKAEIDLSIFETSEWVDLRVWRMAGITKDQVIAAVAHKGGVPPEIVICSDIVRYGKPGQEMDSVFLTLPQSVAERVAEGMELIIGWISVLVKILPAKPVRCSNCMEAGHVRTDCTTDWSCSDQCFRCCGVGHKAAECTKPPYCVLCAEVGKPSSHSVGDRACTAPSEIKWNR